MQMTPDDLKDIIDMDAAAGGGAGPYSWVSMPQFLQHNHLADNIPPAADHEAARRPPCPPPVAGPFRRRCREGDRDRDRDALQERAQLLAVRYLLDPGSVSLKE